MEGRDYGWIVVPKSMVDYDNFWDALSFIFWPDRLTTSFTINGMTYILGTSDHFPIQYESKEHKHEAPTYDVVLDDMDDFCCFIESSMCI